MPIAPDNLPEAVRKPNVMPDKEIREKIEEATKEYNARHEDFQIGVIPDRFLPEEDSSKVVLVSVDDVLVKHQKDERRAGFVKEKKNVANTVIHIHADGKSYILTAVGIRKAFILLLLRFCLRMACWRTDSWCFSQTVRRRSRTMRRSSSPGDHTS